MNSIELASVTHVVIFAVCATKAFAMTICPRELPLRVWMLCQYTHQWTWTHFAFSHFPPRAASSNSVRIGNFQNAQTAASCSKLTAPAAPYSKTNANPSPALENHNVKGQHHPSQPQPNSG